MVPKQCALFVKLPRECSQQARKVNQSVLVALSVIANISCCFCILFGGALALRKETGAESPGTIFFWYTSSRSMMCIMTKRNFDYLITVSSKNSWCWNICLQIKQGEGFNLGMVQEFFFPFFLLLARAHLWETECLLFSLSGPCAGQGNADEVLMLCTGVRGGSSSWEKKRAKG